MTAHYYANVTDEWGDTVEVGTSKTSTGGYDYRAREAGSVFLDLSDCMDLSETDAVASLTPSAACDLANRLLEAAAVAAAPDEDTAPNGRTLLPIAVPTVDAVHPDAPDLDPAEPKPEGGGCCGGGCCG